MNAGGDGVEKGWRSRVYGQTLMERLQETANRVFLYVEARCRRVFVSVVVGDGECMSRGRVCVMKGIGSNPGGVKEKKEGEEEGESRKREKRGNESSET